MGRIRTLSAKVFGDDLPTLAAALSFYSALSFAPLILLILAALGSMELNLQGQFLTEVENLMGAGSAETIRQVMTYADQHPEFVSGANIFGVVALIFSASGIFAQLRTSLNKIFCCPDTDPASWRVDLGKYLAHRALSVSIVLLFVVISIVSLAASTFLTLLINPHVSLVGQILHFTATFAVFASILAALFHWLPDRAPSWRASWVGGLSTATLFMAGKFVIAIYLDRGFQDLVYGAAGSLVVLLLWVYYSSFTIFLGAEIASIRPRT